MKRMWGSIVTMLVVACLLGLTGGYAYADNDPAPEKGGKGRARARQAMEGKEQRREEARTRQGTRQRHREELQKARKERRETLKSERKAFRETMKGMEPQQAAQALRTFLQGRFADNNAFLESQYQKRLTAFTSMPSREEGEERIQAKRTEVLERMQTRHQAHMDHRRAQQEKTLALLNELAGNPELTKQQLHESMRTRREERREAMKSVRASHGGGRPEKGERGGRRANR